MAINLYSGTPGSGKSFHVSKDIFKLLQRGKNVIANFPIALDVIPRVKGHFEYWDNSEITPKALAAYAIKNHRIGKEGQTTVVIDEAQILFNCRDYANKNRGDWIKFFSQHRKLGFSLILIAQNDRMLDRQLRSLVETEYRHRKINNYGFGGIIFSLFTFGTTWFLSIEYWYGGNKLKLSQEMFPYRAKYSKIYDSFALFDEPDQPPADGSDGHGAGALCPAEPPAAAVMLDKKAPAEYSDDTTQSRIRKRFLLLLSQFIARMRVCQVGKKR